MSNLDRPNLKLNLFASMLRSFAEKMHHTDVQPRKDLLCIGIQLSVRFQCFNTAQFRIWRAK